MALLVAHLLHLSALRARRSRLRFSLAESIESLLREVDVPRTSLTSSLPVQRRSVEAARDELAALASQLRTDADVSSFGLHLTRALLTNASGPLYTPHAPGALALEAREARIALRNEAGR